MAIHAVLAHWRMLPEKGTSLVLVAGVALIIDRVGADELLCLRPVRVVTSGALQLKRAAFVPEQVPRALEHSFAYVRVTAKTGLSFRLFSHQFALFRWSVDGMAAQTANARRLMRAGAPEHNVFVAHVAVQAGGSDGLRLFLPLVGDEVRFASYHVLGGIAPMTRSTVEFPAADSELHCLSMTCSSEFIRQTSVALHAGQALTRPP